MSYTFPTITSLTDVERFLKVTKAVYSDQPASLGADMVNECVSFNVFITNMYVFRGRYEGKSKISPNATLRKFVGCKYSSGKSKTEFENGVKNTEESDLEGNKVINKE